MLENVFLRATDGDDFVGVQCYTRMHFGPEGLAGNDPTVPLTQMGDERWPQAVEHTVRRAAAVSGRPVVVTENGIATDDDTERISFLSEALQSAHRCLDEGIDLRGYFVWSLLDNFEWHLGYGPKFGIVAVAPGPSSGVPSPAPTGSARWPGPTPSSRQTCSPLPGDPTGHRARVAPCFPGSGRFYDWLHTHEGRKIFRYTMVSVISTAVSAVVIVLVYGVAKVWTEVPSTIFANAVATFPPTG
jgi:hypothetical protein